MNSTSPYAGDPALVDPRHQHHHSASSAGSAAPDPGLDLLSEDWLQSLRLMHHYSTVTCNALPSDACTEELWKTAIPEMACSHVSLVFFRLSLPTAHFPGMAPLPWVGWW